MPLPSLLAGPARQAPKPFTEAELKKLLAQVPATFDDPVKVARVTGSESALASGLEDGETIVTDGFLLLTDGARVAVQGARPGA